MSTSGQFTSGNLLKSVEICRTLHSDQREPVPQDDSAAAVIGLNFAARAADRPAFAQPKPVKPVVIDRSKLPIG